jgi:hypothetical protein
MHSSFRGDSSKAAVAAGACPHLIIPDVHPLAKGELVFGRQRSGGFRDIMRSIV